MTTYKTAGQCGDGSQRLERKSRGQSRLAESCEGSQSPPKAIVLLLLLMMMMMMTYNGQSSGVYEGNSYFLWYNKCYEFIVNASMSWF
jgi:hypothetical protein